MDSMTWILVADASTARFFRAHKASLFNGNGGNLSLIGTHTHEDSRKSDSELVSDKQGRFGHATFVEKTDPHKHQEDIFALALARKLTQDFDVNHFKNLIIIAPPTFMGLLNKHIESHPIAKLENLKIEKDYTRYDAAEIVKRLQDYL